MGTQGVLSLVDKKGETVIKVVVGRDGQLLDALMGTIQKDKLTTVEQIHVAAMKQGFGCGHDLVIMNKMQAIVMGSDGKAMGPLYRSTFHDPRFNPRWEHGTADHVLVANLPGNKCDDGYPGVVAILDPDGKVRLKVFAKCGGQNFLNLTKLIDDRKLRVAGDIQQVYKAARDVEFGCKECLVVMSQDHNYWTSSACGRDNHPGELYIHKFDEPNYNPYGASHYHAYLPVLPKHKPLKDMTLPELEATEWDYIRKTLEDCQRRFEMMTGRMSWIDPAIDICKERAGEIRKWIHLDEKAASRKVLFAKGGYPQKEIRILGDFKPLTVAEYRRRLFASWPVFPA
jgi:hypothetical protein